MRKRIVTAAAVMLVSLNTFALAESPRRPPVETLISQVQDALFIVARKLPDESLPPLNTAEVTLQTTVGTSQKGGFEFFVVTFGGKIDEEEVQSIVLTLTPPSPKDPSPVAASDFAAALADLIVASAKSAKKAQDRQPALELSKLVASISFVVKSSGEAGLKLVFVPVTLNFGGGISKANMHKVQLTFGKADKK